MYEYEIRYQRPWFWAVYREYIKAKNLADAQARAEKTVKPGKVLSVRRAR